MTTLREQAAIAAIQGLLADGEDRRSSGPLSTAQTAVEYADALVAELASTSPVSPEPTAGACTAAERELIEAVIAWDGKNLRDSGLKYRQLVLAMEVVSAERRTASEAKGGVQP